MKFKLGSLRTQMFVTVLFVVSGLAVILMLIAALAMRSGFSEYLHSLELQRLQPVAEALEAHYASEENWQELAGDDQSWRRWLSVHLLPEEFRQLTPPPPGPGGRPPHLDMGHRPPPRRDKLGLVGRTALLDTSGVLICGSPQAARSKYRTPVSFQQRTVGYLALARGNADSSLDRQFVRSQWPTVLLLMLSALVGSFAASWFLAKNLTRPLLLLSQGARRMAEGELEVRVDLDRDDELGQLAANFNSMAQTLEFEEKARKKWLADTSHELRTPVAIIQAEIEAIQDGIHQADEKTLGLLHAEAKGLGKLIRGLGKLGMSPQDDNPVYRELDLESFLVKAVSRFETRFTQHEVELECRDRQSVVVLGDHIGLETLVSNLLENSMRYTNRGGRVEWSLHREARFAVVTFDDTEPAPKPENLERLFERFFREESSRSRKLGGSGIGLSLCKQIVEEHGGTIEAQISPLGGLRIRMKFPLAKQELKGENS